MLNKPLAFSLIELSVVILIIGILIAGVTQGSRLIGQSRIESAKAQTRSATISSISNIAIWLETVSDDSVVSVNNSGVPQQGDKVQTWNDFNQQKISKTNLTQSTDSVRTTYQENAINGLPALKFDSSRATYFQTTNIIGRDSSVFVVMKTSSPGAAGEAYAGRAILSADQSGLSADIIPLALGSGYAKIFTGTNSSNAQVAINTLVNSNTLISDDAPHIICTTRNSVSGLRSVSVDGEASRVTDSAGTGNLNGNSSLYIGSFDATGTLFSNSYDGYIGEIIIFDRALKTNERQEVFSYLSSKWKINIR